MVDQYKMIYHIRGENMEVFIYRFFFFSPGVEHTVLELKSVTKQNKTKHKKEKNGLFSKCILLFLYQMLNNYCDTTSKYKILR